jgi:hypothetical protein
VLLNTLKVAPSATAKLPPTPNIRLSNDSIEVFKSHSGFHGMTHQALDGGFVAAQAGADLDVGHGC